MNQILFLLYSLEFELGEPGEGNSRKRPNLPANVMLLLSSIDSRTYGGGSGGGGGGGFQNPYNQNPYNHNPYSS